MTTFIVTRMDTWRVEAENAEAAEEMAADRHPSAEHLYGHADVREDLSLDEIERRRQEALAELRPGPRASHRDP